MRWAKNLKIANGADASQVDIDADELSIEGVGFVDVDLTADFDDAGADGLDTGAEAGDTWYAVWVISDEGGSKIASLLSLSGSAPTMPATYTTKRLVHWVRNDTGSDLYEFKHPAGTDDHWWDENISAGDFLLKDAVLGAADTWEDVDASAVCPEGATHANLYVSMVRIAPALMIVRVKDKDLGNITTVGDTLSTSGATRVGASVRVSLDSVRKFQIQGNTTTFNVFVLLRGWEMPHD